MKVTNQGSMAVAVRIVEPRGVNYVHVVPKRSVDLPEGAVVDPNWLALNATAIKVSSPTSPAKQVAAPASTPTKTVEIAKQR